MGYPRIGTMRNSVWFNNNDEIDRLAADGGVRFHSQFSCQRSEACVIHNPSDHHMNRWPRVLRGSALVERTCPHGTGHPDPDSLAFFESIGRKGYGVHGCDGCCKAPAPKEKTSVIVLDERGTTWRVERDERGLIFVHGGPIPENGLAAALAQLSK